MYIVPKSLSYSVSSDNTILERCATTTLACKYNYTGFNPHYMMHCYNSVNIAYVAARVNFNRTNLSFKVFYSE